MTFTSFSPSIPLKAALWLQGFLGHRTQFLLLSFPFLCAKSLNHIWLFAILWTVAFQAPLSMGFPKQKHWSGLFFLSAGYLPSPGIKPGSLTSPALAGKFFTTGATWEAQFISSSRTLLCYPWLLLASTHHHCCQHSLSSLRVLSSCSWLLSLVSSTFLYHVHKA